MQFRGADHRLTSALTSRPHLLSYLPFFGIVGSSEETLGAIGTSERSAPTSPNHNASSMNPRRLATAVFPILAAYSLSVFSSSACQELLNALAISLVPPTYWGRSSPSIIVFSLSVTLNAISFILSFVTPKTFAGFEVDGIPHRGKNTLHDDSRPADGPAARSSS